MLCAILGKVTMTFHFKDLGIIGYKEGYVIQKQFVEKIQGGEDPVVLLCEHPVVLTLGRLANEDNLLISKEKLKKRKISVEHIDRGGEVTLHSPGQLVIYSIVDLRYFGKDLHDFMRKLEQVAIDLLGDFGIVADRFLGRTGVWVGSKKIVSIGIGVKKWISFHGMAINVNTDLNLFSMIKPCGLDVSMTSISEIQKKIIDMNRVKKNLIECFNQKFYIEKGNRS